MLNEPPAIQDGTFGDVAPIYDQREKLQVARVDFLGKLVAGAALKTPLRPSTPAPSRNSMQITALCLGRAAGAGPVLKELYRTSKDVSCRSLVSKLSHTRLLMPSVCPALGSWNPG